MRVTRNYMSSLLSSNNNLNTTTSLLQRALSRSSKSKRASRTALLMNSSSKSNFCTTTPSNTASTQRLYYNMKYHAGQVADYADKLTSTDDTSLFAKAKESGNTAEIVSNIKGFVSQYNSMLQNLNESGGRTDSLYLTQLNSISRVSSFELQSCGVTRNSDGTLTVDDKKLSEADVETLEKVWNGNSSFAGRAALWADSVETSAERNMAAETSSAYSSLLSNYGISGNFFNYLS